MSCTHEATHVEIFPGLEKPFMVDHNFFLAIHLGAGYHSPDSESDLQALCRRVCLGTKELLAHGACATDAVAFAIQQLEATIPDERLRVLTTVG